MHKFEQLALQFLHKLTVKSQMGFIDRGPAFLSRLRRDMGTVDIGQELCLSLLDSLWMLWCRIVTSTHIQASPQAYIVYICILVPPFNPNLFLLTCFQFQSQPLHEHISHKSTKYDASLSLCNPPTRAHYQGFKAPIRHFNSNPCHFVLGTLTMTLTSM